MLEWTLGAVFVPVRRLITPLARRGALLLGVGGGAADEAPRLAPGVIPVPALNPVGFVGIVPSCLEV